MSITVKDHAGIRRIDVLGDLSGPMSRDDLLTALTLRGDLGVEITFYDARTLPGIILETLLNLRAAGVSLKIYTYHNHLLYHLMRFGLQVLGVFSANTLPVAPEVSAVVLGGSANSLDKILAIVEALPVGNTVIFIVQHILEDEPNLLDKLLRVRTDYVVEMPQHLTEIMPGAIYIAPPGHQMKVAHGLIYLTRDKKVNFARPSIEVLFKSVAAEYREHCLGVLLCGHGNDGVAGLQAIKNNGGCVLVENSDDCGAHALTDAGIAGGAFDFVFSLPELCCFVAAAVAGRSREFSPQLIDLLLEAVYSRYGHDYRNYQRNTVERRLNHICSKLGIDDFFNLQRELLTDPEAFEHLFLELSINITAFFRHPAQFKALREKVLPYLDSFSSIKIWSAGCANGKEAYSLAILLDELGMLEKTQIFATDINPYQLEEGKNGLYPLEKREEGQCNYLAGGGQGLLDDWMSTDQGYLKMAPRLRKHLIFYQHSLGHDGPFNEFQLIICRNVLIYFHPSLQQGVMELFSDSLHQDGFLMLGPSENINAGKGEDFFSPYAKLEKIYRRHKTKAQANA
ncbi:MAG: CheR family methyltransferase [Gammaproteobacteria bacterium]